jgi:hypothetical protein
MEVFTAISPAITITVLWNHAACLDHRGSPHRAVAIAQDQNTVVLPVEVAFDVGAEVLAFLMDEDDARNRHGLTLSEFLGGADEMELRRILAKITDPLGSTYTNP